MFYYYLNNYLYLYIYKVRGKNVFFLFNETTFGHFLSR